MSKKKVVVETAEVETAETAKAETTAKAEYVRSAQEQYFADNNTGVTAEINENTLAVNQAQANEDYWSANGQR